MARKRMIDPGIWQSEDFSKLSKLGKLVFIGLFSLADDEGRGRCNPVYIKSTLFPYEEDIRSADIDKALLEISSNMSVIFYSYNGSNYYYLYNWNVWQKIDRPTSSKLPEFDENNKEFRLLFEDNSSNSSRGLSANKNRIKKNKNKKEFIPPTIEEIKRYIEEKNLNVDAEHFLNYFTEGNWIDAKGNEVKNWKQKILTWNSYDKEEKKKNDKNTNYNNYEKRDYKDLNSLYSNKGVN